MTAMRLAASSLRYRGPSLVATFLSIFLGATILMAFMSLLDIAWQPGTSEKDATFLTTVSNATLSIPHQPTTLETVVRKVASFSDVPRCRAMSRSDMNALRMVPPRQMLRRVA